MSKLIVMSGVPGSGKSYLASAIRKKCKSHLYIISSDGLRKIITGDPQNHTEEALMWPMYYELAKVYSMDKKGIVIFDSTNIYKKHRFEAVQQLKDKFDEFDCVIFDIDPKIVDYQNVNRRYPVPKEVLENMRKDFEDPDEEEKAFFNKIIYVNNLKEIHSVVRELLKN